MAPCSSTSSAHLAQRSSRQRAIVSALCGVLLCLSHCHVADAAAAAAAAAAADCDKLGFTGLQSCADCDSMLEYVKDEGLVAECRSCCVADAAADDTKYDSATLVVCPFKLNGLPAIQDFIDKHAQKVYGKVLKVEKLINSPPTLVLRHKASDATKSVRIDMWKVPTIHEFLQGRLESWGSKKKKGGAKKTVETSKKKK